MNENNINNGGFLGFFKRNTHILIPMFGILALLLFLNPFLSYKIEVDGVKSKFSINLATIFSGSIPQLWVVYVVLGLIVLGVIFSFLTKVMKDAEVIAGFSFLMALTLMFALREILAQAGIENFYSAEYEVAAGWIIFVLALCIVLCFISSSLKESITVAMMSEDGILIAAAFVLNFIKIDLFPGAGSFNLQFFPLFIIALRRNAFHSFLCGGIIFGLLTCFTDGYGIQTYPFDYLIGFGSIALLSIFRKYILSDNIEEVKIKGIIFLFVGIFLATLLRLIGSTISSMVIYEYSFQTALLYNLTYVPATGLAAFILMVVSYKFLIRFNKNHPTTCAY